MINKDREKNAATIILEGDLDATQVVTLRPQLRALVDEGYLDFTFDFSQSRFMCSAGLGALVEVYNSVVQSGGSVLALNMNAHLKQLLTDTKLLPLFTSRTASDSSRLSALDAVQRHMSQELLFLSYLSTITSNVLQADITEDICELTLEGVLRSLSCTRGFLLLVAEGPNGPLLRVAAAEGFSPETCSCVEEMAVGDGTLEKECLASMQAALISPDTLSEGLPSPLLRIASVKQGILTPMIGRHAALGLLLIEGQEDAPSFFTQSTPLVQVFSNVCGLALEKQSLLEDIQYKNAQLSRTLAELNKAQATLMEAGKLAALGALSRGLGHTLNNKLVPILGYTQMIHMQLQPESDMARKVKIIESSAMDIKRIIDNLRAVARREELRFESHDLREVMDSAIYMLDYMFRGEKILVERGYASDDCVIQIDRARIIQAFLALFHRLPQALNQTQTRRVRIDIHRNNNVVEARIIDNGRVPSAQELENILDPFTQDTGPSEIDRFNFSIANGIAKDHRGSLSVQAGDGGGVCAVMQFPVLQARG